MLLKTLLKVPVDDPEGVPILVKTGIGGLEAALDCPTSFWTKLFEEPWLDFEFALCVAVVSVLTTKPVCF